MFTKDHGAVFCSSQTISTMVSNALLDKFSVGEIKFPAALLSKTSIGPKWSITCLCICRLAHNLERHKQQQAFTTRCITGVLWPLLRAFPICGRLWQPWHQVPKNRKSWPCQVRYPTSYNNYFSCQTPFTEHFIGVCHTLKIQYFKRKCLSCL